MNILDFIDKHQFTLPVVSDIALFYPLTWAIVEQYRDKLDWNLLLLNPHLDWEIDELERQYKSLKKTQKIESIFRSLNDKLTHLPWSERLYFLFDPEQPDFHHFSSNEYINWTAELIEKYRDKWDWRELSLNEGIPFSIEILQKFQHLWIGGLISQNDKLKFSIPLIEFFYDFENFWVFDFLSSQENFVSHKELLIHYRERIDWEQVCKYSSIFADPLQIEAFRDVLVPASLLMNPHVRSLSKAFIYQVLEEKRQNKAQEHYFWQNFSENACFACLLVSAPDLLHDFATELNFKGISSNRYLPKNNPLIETFSSRWDWQILSGHVFYEQQNQTYIGWSMAQIEQFSDRWNWDALCSGAFVDWELPMVIKYLERMPKGQILKHPRLALSEELMDLWDRYFDEIEWDSPSSMRGATSLLSEDQIEQILQNAPDFSA
ncbi:hypothetical protein COW36_18185 [bacterium (Candidatus Blackallbacteria) CG17_big_fil_post_rev_8_21_14_2_50_48_46]|uniref:Uncharacterized protein n=1 Tax=bacterium (Candidatus Blackallbacteria) CG17_big_fil_post_rev_8_21_14_2_50_48_46 TaxID=2014261 RepID=A0A2M7G0V5_9BACT|nr:MAG: hypothetical protein COW64_00545 [bacterium (Candidatus Blackallbacteria) CG18_big_fil_WC_8_21_14_2_50_49_26]PIW15345.1 MAG: hypothetical protein COW36_18185 [bacterium (Candidatus Blackallbacteria) CG17_big_fil_post_rev_8_21_14_2_50_48_46]PIW49794.1 MAG: hypothetical protein COW20_05180 [bacterium (Candidatus Blackallbacteria) CG13_big_fil_rev_8_21_14_2_50_49_14]